MYAPFFGLSREPFSIAPDPRFLFMSERHREALAHLLYGVGGGGGFVLLTGEIGAGKTTVGRCFLEQLPAHCTVAYIFNPKLSVSELLQTICSEFGLPLAPGETSIKAQTDALNRFLLQAHAQGRQALLVIDEAQSLSAEVLEQLRLLTNLETAERKLLQIILIGQPELREMLAQPGLEQLAQRVIARYHLGPLSRQESAQYVAHRLAVAGPDGAAGAAAPFDAAAMAALHRLTGGVPRRINLLADRSLLGAYAQGQHRVDTRTVVQAAAEVFGSARAAAPRAGAGSAGMLLAGALLGLSLGALVLAAWVWQQRSVEGFPKPAPVAAAASVAGSALPAASASASASAAQVASAPLAPSSEAAAVVAASADVSATPTASGPGPALAASAPSMATTDLAAVQVVPLADPGDLLAAAHLDEGTAWRELALHWQVAVGNGEPCQVVAQAHLACLRMASGGLPALRLAARPALLTLRGPTGHRVFALLVALDAEQAVLQVGNKRWRMGLANLASIWRGEAATLWRTPPAWRDNTDPTTLPRSRAWIVQQLPPLAEGAASTLRDRIAAFQLMQGLPPDGRAGPLTLMQLNRRAGVDEPRLETTIAG